MQNNIKILLAEDEVSLGKIISESLINKGYNVIICLDGDQAIHKFEVEQPDILVLDVMMPKKDGFTVAKEIRKNNNTIPILFLTAKSQTKDVIEGFESGGNDYLKKPFSMEELVVRINNLLRYKINKSQNDIVNIGKYKFSSKKQKLYLNKIETNLTSRETELLQQLYLHKNEVLEKDYILTKLWGNNDFFKSRSMDVFITKLRKKLKDDSTIQIVNIRGYGYKIII